ncbi:MAG: ATPase [Treponema sp.]|jgi:hypothetical protein|nr:ATPase [Treponema sp.]
MEELQSTEILDREILEDARKKAGRLLGAADESAAAAAALWDKKTKDSLTELKGRYDAMLANASAEIMARLPLDERRARSEIIENLLASAADDWVSGLGPERVLSLLEGEFKKYCGEYPELREETGFRVRLHNISVSGAKPLVARLFPRADGEFIEEKAAHLYPEIIIDCGPVRVTASIRGILDALLLDRREELVSALIGQDAEGGLP